MTFTDDDVKRLKEQSSASEAHGVAGHYPLTFQELKALLARMEAAEITCFKSIDRRSYCLCEACKAWRKAVGR